MIDTEKWKVASDETKMQAVKAIKAVMRDDAITKTDSAIITDYLLNKVEEDK